MTCGGVPKSKLCAFIPPFGMWFVNCEFEWVETNGVALDNGDELGCRDCFPGGITIWEKFFSILTKVDQVTVCHRCKRTFHVICHWCWNCVLLLGRDVDIWDVWYKKIFTPGQFHRNRNQSFLVKAACQKSFWAIWSVSAVIARSPFPSYSMSIRLCDGECMGPTK